jgi:alkanesulfonate monooxygenase SsuD/methylene tetrahydromethanopterin reductase-like flavin-dependent oxidoreductase (luciferase family)
MASAIDDLSGGRLQLGIGAGWQTREHDGYGFDLLDIPARLQRYREGVEVVSLLLHGDEPVQFEGTFYRLHDAILLPRPQRPGGPPIVIGGGKAVLPLAARFADEWNCGFESPASFARLSARLDELVQQQGRQPGEVRRSLMTMLVFGRDDAELQRKLERQGRSAGELREDNAVVGTGSAVIDQLGELAAAGVQRVMLQWLDLDDLDGLAAFAAAVLPHV